MRLAELIIGLLLFSVSAFAFSQTIEVRLEPDGTAQVTHEILVQTETGFTVSLIALPSTTPNVQFFNQAGAFQIQENQIVFSQLQSSSTISLSYETLALTNKQGSEWSIDVNNIPPGIAQLKILLPPHSKITQFQPVASIFFDDPNLVITWQPNQLAPTNRIFVSYSTTLQTPNEWQNWLLGIGLMIIIAGGIVLWNANRVLHAKPVPMHSAALQHPLAQSYKGFSSGQTDTVKTLSEKETKLLEILLANDGCTQKNLLHQSGLSKATLSRTLKLLEQKELVRLVPDGYSNKVFLSDWFKNK